MKIRNTIPLFVACAILSGCVAGGMPKGALEWNDSTMKLRQLQSKRFEVEQKQKLDELMVLRSAVLLLQDEGYNLASSEAALGVLHADKDADASEAGQMAGKVVMAALFGADIPVDTVQKFKVSVVTRVQTDKDSGKKFVIVRVTFQRIVWNERGQISKLESLEDPKLYEKFFGELSKSLFLTANDI
jgi:hypothetical protein